MKIFLCRHAKTNWNDSELILGQMELDDVFISNESENEFIEKNKFLHKENISKIISSDLFRAKHSAEILNKLLDVPLLFGQKFRALNMGAYQGKSVKEFLSAASIHGYFSDYDIQIKDGESINDLILRFQEGIKDVIRNFSREDNIVIISHSAAISNWVSYIEKKPYKDITDAVIIVENDNPRVLKVVNN